jgi:hypothetical protein
MKKCHLRRGSIYLNVSLWSARVIAIAELQSEIESNKLIKYKEQFQGVVIELT